MSTIYRSQTNVVTNVGDKPLAKSAQKKKGWRYPLCNLYPKEEDVLVGPSVSGKGTLVTTKTEEMALRFDDGAEYRGEMQHNRPHGEGAFVRSDKSYHNGFWFNGRPHGPGVAEYGHGACYSGSYSEGQRNGKGKYVCPTYTYEGEWRNGAMDGHGRLTWAGMNQVYEGGFKSNKFDGAGHLRHANGSVYDGGFVGGMRHGRGVLVMPDGSRYNGQWEMDVPTQAAVYSDHAGNSVVGQWEQGKFSAKRG